MQYGRGTKASLDASIDYEYEHDYEYDAPLFLAVPLLRVTGGLRGGPILVRMTPRNRSGERL